MKKIIIGILVIVIIAAGGYYGLRRFGFLNREFAKDSYQAVFLSNGQVYFGKVNSMKSEYVNLTDIYYLIRKEPLQPQTPPEEGAEPEAAQPEYTVVKLGKELHGPKDKMIINRKHILFIEDLKNDSKLVTAINSSKENESSE